VAVAATTAAAVVAAGTPAAVAGGAAAVADIVYTQSVQHFLLIGTLGMLFGAIAFLLLGARYQGNKLFHVIVFFAAVVSCCAYYAQWTGMGVFTKTSEDPPRIIFWARYVDHVITFPLLLIATGLLAKSNMSTLVSLVGNSMLMVIVMLIGALVLAPFKYIWWTAGVAFFAIVVVQLLVQLNESARVLSPSASDALKVLTTIICLSWAVYPICWVLGSEGLYTMHMSVEVGLLTLVDWTCKLGFGGYLAMQRDAFEDLDTIGETTKLRPTSELV